MSKGRFKDIDWNLADEKDLVGTWERVQIAVLMDIRDELKALNRTLGCYRLQRMADATIRMEKRLARTVKLR